MRASGFSIPEAMRVLYSKLQRGGWTNPTVNQQLSEWVRDGAEIQICHVAGRCEVHYRYTTGYESIWIIPHGHDSQVFKQSLLNCAQGIDKGDALARTYESPPTGSGPHAGMSGPESGS